MKVAFQIDPPNAVTLRNCTLAMMEEAQLRGYDVFHFAPGDVVLRNNEVLALVGRLHVDLSSDRFMNVTDQKLATLHDMDVVFIRQEPIFDVAFITNTYLLDRVAGDALVINDPAQVRNFPEKLSYFGFESHRPATLITNNAALIEAFWEEQGDIVIKPLFSYGGTGVFHIPRDSNNLRVTVETLTTSTKLPVVAQRFIPGVYQTDKRVLLLYGEIAGAYRRTPRARDIRANVFSGGTISASELTSAEADLAARLASVLLEERIYIAGVDLIDGQLTEINVATPAGFLPLRELYGLRPERGLFDHIEQHVAFGSPTAPRAGLA